MMVKGVRLEGKEVAALKKAERRKVVEKEGRQKKGTRIKAEEGEG